MDKDQSIETVSAMKTLEREAHAQQKDNDRTIEALKLYWKEQSPYYPLDRLLENITDEIQAMVESSEYRDVPNGTSYSRIFRHAIMNLLQDEQDQ